LPAWTGIFFAHSDIDDTKSRILNEHARDGAARYSFSYAACRTNVGQNEPRPAWRAIGINTVTALRSD